MNRCKPWLQLAGALAALSLPWAADPALQAAATMALWLATEALERQGRPRLFRAWWTPVALSPRRDSVVC